MVRLRATFSCMIFLLLWFVFAGVSFAQANNAIAQDDVKIAQIPDGGYSVTTTSYQAKIGADGNLHSFCINGVEFIDDHTAASMGVSFFVEQPIPLPQQHLDRNVLTATDGVYTAKYTFEAGYVIDEFNAIDAKRMQISISADFCLIARSGNTISA
ncbi:MAG TPA: hypothetical protein VHV83_19665, partial [Armatimonadota bacterium]|nr:hypothetical protein [Armatimonadota bacterium]